MIISPRKRPVSSVRPRYIRHWCIQLVRANTVEREVITPQNSGTPTDHTPNKFDELTVVHLGGQKRPVKERAILIIS